MKKKGFFITTEGIDGSGKSTQTELLYNYLKNKHKNNCDVICTREPGGNKVSERIREMILDPKCDMLPITELMLYETARSEHFYTKIFKELDNDNIVVCERFIDSTTAYQGYGRGLGKELINKLNFIATNGVLPDITFLFDVDPKIGLARVKSRNNKLDRIEREGVKFQDKVRIGYLEIAKENKERIKLISVDDKSIEEVHNEVVSIIENVIYKTFIC